MKFLASLLIIVFASSLHAQTVVKIIDGDTFKAALDGDTVTVRLCGVDTPESKKNSKAKKDAARSGQDLAAITSLGKRSTEFLKRQLPIGSTVRLEYDVRKTDRYGRLLAYVYRGKTFINQTLIDSGMATTMTIAPNVKYAERFREAQRRAEKARVGNWR